MTIDIKKRVDVVVSLGTSPLETQSFDTPFFLVGTSAFTEDFRIYDQLDDVLDDFAEGSPAYKMAAKAFGGLFAPRQVYIGKRGVSDIVITPTAADNTTYELNIKADGVDAFITFTSGTSATATTIVTGLTAAIGASAVDGLVTVSGTDTLVLAPITTLSVGLVSDNLASALTYSETSVTSASRARSIDDTWYYIASDDHDPVEVEALAAYAEGIDCIYATSSDDPEMWNPASTTSIGSRLAALGYDHATVLPHLEADTEFPEAGLFGAMASLEKGTSTLTDKSLTGVATSDWSASQVAVFETNNNPYYINFVGSGSVFNSKMASGQYWDTIEFADWFKARLAESVYGAIKQRSMMGLKTSYDLKGKGVIRQAISSVCQRGQALGSISLDFDPVIRIPTNAEISDADRANRLLPNVVVEVQYTNAIETVQIRAYVSI